MKIRALIFCCTLVMLLTACSKSSDFPKGSQDVKITQEQKGVTLTLTGISYKPNSPTPNDNSMFLNFDISNKTTDTLVIYGSTDPKKVTDNLIIMIGQEAYTPIDYGGGGPKGSVKATRSDGKSDFTLSVSGGILAAKFHFGARIDALSPPDFKKPIKCIIPAKLGSEKIEFVFDLPSPPK